MNPKELANHKTASKRLDSAVVFKALKRGKLPKPLHKLGGARIQSTDLLKVSDTHQVVFIWRDGELLTDSAFFGYLFCVLDTNELSPLLEMHFHPSHKGLHVKLPCKTQFDYTSRMLPGAPELALTTRHGIDPRQENDRFVLIDRFCKCCGIAMGLEGGLLN